MRVSTIFCFLVLTLSAAATEHSNLRSSSARRLWNPFSSLQLPTIQSVIAAFVPALGSSILRTLVLLPSTGTHGSLTLGEQDLGLCVASSALNFTLGIVRGLETFRIETFELVPGTDTFDTHLLGLNGAEWGGTWIFRAGFDHLASTTTATIFAGACGKSANETIGGSFVAENPMMELEFTLAGSSPNLFRLGSSTAKTIDVQQISMPYNSLSFQKLNGVGNGRSLLAEGFSFDLDAELERLRGIFSSNLNEKVIPLIKERLQQDLGLGLPFELD